MRGRPLTTTPLDPSAAKLWSQLLRSSKGLSQRDLARMVRTSPGVIGDLERGIVRSQRVAREVVVLAGGEGE